MGPEGFRPAIKRCRNVSTAVMPDPDKVSTFSHLPDTTRLFARMLFMEVTVRLQARALCVAPLWNRKPVTVSRVSPSAKYWGWVQGYGSLNGGRSPAWTNARLTSSMTSISAKAIIRNVPPRSLLRSA